MESNRGGVNDGERKDMGQGATQRPRQSWKQNKKEASGSGQCQGMTYINRRSRIQGDRREKKQLSYRHFISAHLNSPPCPQETIWEIKIKAFTSAPTPRQPSKTVLSSSHTSHALLLLLYHCCSHSTRITHLN